MKAVSKGLVDIVREHILFIQSAHFEEVIIIMRKNVSKGLERKRRKLAQLMVCLTEIRNDRLGNALDVDLDIT